MEEPGVLSLHIGDGGRHGSPEEGSSRCVGGWVSVCLGSGERESLTHGLFVAATCLAQTGSSTYQDRTVHRLGVT